MAKTKTPPASPAPGKEQAAVALVTELHKMPEPGMYAHLPEDTYHGDPAWRKLFSNSQAGHVLRSPQHLRASQDEEYERTAAMEDGAIAHTAILLPDEFSKFVAAPPGDKRLVANKAKWLELEAKHGEHYVISDKQHRMGVALRDQMLKSHRATMLLFTKGVEREFSVVYDDPETGVRCKLRTDAWNAPMEGGTIVDCKSTKDAREHAFMRSVFTYGYHRQGGSYVDGLNVHGKPTNHFAIIAFEKVPPYAVMFYRLNEAVLDAGRADFRKAIRVYADLLTRPRAEWPGYDDTIRPLALPDWAWNQIADSEDMGA